MLFAMFIVICDILYIFYSTLRTLTPIKNRKKESAKNHENFEELEHFQAFLLSVNTLYAIKNHGNFWRVCTISKLFHFFIDCDI